MVPITSSIKIGDKKLGKVENAKLATFIAAIKDIDEHMGWKAFGKSTQGAKPWIKQEEKKDTKQSTNF